MATQANLDYVQKMFVAYLGRAASASAQEYYADLIDADAELGKAQLFDDLYNSAEAQALYAGMANDQIIDQIFQNCFNRDPAFAGLTYYYNEIAAGTFNILEAAAVIANDAGAEDAAILAAKQTAADKITTAMGSDATAIAEYSANAADARTSLNKVTDATSAAAYDGAAELAAVRTGNQIGATTALSTAADTFSGTSGNDTVTGTNTTMTSGDVITDGFSTDSDTLALTGAQFVNLINTTGSTISGIENVTGTFDSLTDFTLNLAGVADSTNITVSNVRDGSTANATVSNVTNNSTVNAGTGLAGNLTVTMSATGNKGVTVNSAGVAGTTTVTGLGTGNVIVNSGTDAVTAASANGDITITAAGAAAGAISGTATTTAGNTADVLVTADSAVGTVTAATDRGNATVHADATTTTVTATANTGTATVDAAKSLAITTTGVTTNITSGATGTAAAPVVIAVNGSAGTADTATITAKGAVTLTNNVDLEGLTLSGNGAAVTYTMAVSEKVTLTGDQSVTLAGTAAVIAGSTVTDSTTAGTTTASVTLAAANADFSKVGVDVISMGATAGAQTYTFAPGQDIVFTAAPGHATVLDITDNTASTVTGSLDMTLKGAPAAANTITLEATGDKITTLNVTSTVTQPTLAIVAGNTNTVTMSSAANVTMAATSTAKVFDGSAMTGVLTASQTANMLTVKGGSAADVLTITTNTANSGVVGNGGNDNIKVGALTLAATQTIDGGQGTDTLTVTGNADISAATLTSIELIAQGANTLQMSEAQATAGLVFTGTGAVTIDALDSAVDLSGLVFSGAASTVIDTATNSIATLGASAARSVVGTSVADTITGNNGADTLDGGGGDDILIGGAGGDALIGGAGNNTYRYGAGDAATGETITFNTAATATAETIDVTAATNLSAINGGALLTGLDKITMAEAANITVLASQVTGLTLAINGTALNATEVVTVSGATGTVNDTADLSKATMTDATLTISTGAGNDTIKGGASADTIVGGTGADTMTGGAGADVFQIAVATDTGITVATADTITDFSGQGANLDTLKLGLAGDNTAANAATPTTGNYVESTAAVADFAAALAAANTALAVLNSGSSAATLYAFQYDATYGYLFIDTDSDGDADAVIILTGIDHTEIAHNDIVA